MPSATLPLEEAIKKANKGCRLYPKRKVIKKKLLLLLRIACGHYKSRSLKKKRKILPYGSKNRSPALADNLLLRLGLAPQ